MEGVEECGRGRGVWEGGGVWEGRGMWWEGWKNVVGRVSCVVGGENVRGRGCFWEGVRCVGGEGWMWVVGG